MSESVDPFLRIQKKDKHLWREVNLLFLQMPARNIELPYHNFLNSTRLLLRTRRKYIPSSTLILIHPGFFELPGYYRSRHIASTSGEMDIDVDLKCQQQV